MLFRRYYEIITDTQNVEKSSYAIKAGGDNNDLFSPLLFSQKKGLVLSLADL